MTALVTPGRLGGRTAVRIISHRVAPSASAASRWAGSTCRKISRLIAAMIGRIMIASTTEAPKTDLLNAETAVVLSANSGIQPK